MKYLYNSIVRKTILLVLLFSASFVFAYAGENEKIISSGYSIQKAVSQGMPDFSGDLQSQVAGRMLGKPIRVMVSDSTGNPVGNCPVLFKIAGTPDKAENFLIEKQYCFTDSVGIAFTNVTIGSKPGIYEVSATLPFSGNSIVIFKAYARKSNWVFILFISLFGGLGLFLFGMQMLSNSLQRSAGDRMRTILSKLTNNRVIALFVGAFVTMVIQSSSATTVMLVSFVNSRLMKFRQTTGIILGAAVGTTITAQIIAFKLSEYSLLLIALGFLLMVISGKNLYKDIGASVLGFGILFFGMQIMSDAMYPLRTHEVFINTLLHLETPILGILAGALFTALIQSSSAFIGIIIILGSQGLLTLEAVIPLLIGANLGTAITAILASLNASRESKQVALAHTLFKLIGALLLVWWIPRFTDLIYSITKILSGTEIVNQTSDYMPRQIANAHTIYNITLAAIFLPFTNSLAILVNWILPIKEDEQKKPEVKYLDEKLLISPALAINVARKEVAGMIDITRHMVEEIKEPFLVKNNTGLAKIREEEKTVNYLRDSIKEYLLKVSRENINPQFSEEIFQLMFAVTEFEQIADLVSGPLSDKAESWCNSDHEFSDSGGKELDYYHKETIQLIDKAYELIGDGTRKKAKKLKKQYEEFRKLTIEMERLHYERLKDQVEDSVDSSNTHLELITMLKIISSHVTNTARIILQNKHH